MALSHRPPATNLQLVPPLPRFVAALGYICPYYTSAYYVIVTNRRTHASQLIDAMTIAQNEIVATPIDDISTAVAEFARIPTTYGRS